MLQAQVEHAGAGNGYAQMDWDSPAGRPCPAAVPAETRVINCVGTCWSYFVDPIGSDCY